MLQSLKTTMYNNDEMLLTVQLLGRFFKSVFQSSLPNMHVFLIKFSVDVKCTRVTFPCICKLFTLELVMLCIYMLRSIYIVCF